MLEKLSAIKDPHLGSYEQFTVIYLIGGGEDRVTCLLLPYNPVTPLFLFFVSTISKREL